MAKENSQCLTCACITLLDHSECMNSWILEITWWKSFPLIKKRQLSGKKKRNKNPTKKKTNHNSKQIKQPNPPCVTVLLSGGAKGISLCPSLWRGHLPRSLGHRGPRGWLNFDPLWSLWGAEWTSLCLGTPEGIASWGELKLSVCFFLWYYFLLKIHAA